MAEYYYMTKILFTYDL